MKTNYLTEKSINKNILLKNCICLLLCAFSFFPYESNAQCSGGQASIELEVNNVSAKINMDGHLWHKGQDGEGYQVPKNGGVAALYTGSIWMGGVNEIGSIKIAAPLYSPNQSEYWPGPINDGGFIYPEACSNWDRFFKVDRYEITSHIADWQDNFYIDNNVPAQLLSWPGRNNPYFQEVAGFNLPINASIAPFVDVDGDNIYDPYNGDYPLIKGDQCIAWVFNDVGGSHEQTLGARIGMEVFAMAYGYNTGIDVIDNSTFYDFKFTYKGLDNLSDFHFAFFADPDLGCNRDDFIGCVPTENLAYAYNQDDFDQDCPTGYQDAIPVIGIKYFDTPNNVGLSYFSHAFSTIDLPFSNTNPNGPEEYFNILRGLWSNGTPISQGGNGYNPDQPAYPYAYDGTIIGGVPWTECNFSEDESLTDRRIIMGFGPFDLNPGDIHHLRFAVIYDRNVEYNCPSPDVLVEDSNILESFETQYTEAIQAASPVALFDALQSDEFNITFTDHSLFESTSWLWDFGDGNTSSEQYPNHTYAQSGSYEVCLEVSNVNGSNSICNLIELSESQIAKADFNFTVNGLTVNFEDQSGFNPTEWTWTFGDGNYVFSQNPVHQFQEEGMYEVCLTATNEIGGDIFCMSVEVFELLPPVAFSMLMEWD